MSILWMTCEKRKCQRPGPTSYCWVCSMLARSKEKRNSPGNVFNVVLSEICGCQILPNITASAKRFTKHWLGPPRWELVEGSITYHYIKEGLGLDWPNWGLLVKWNRVESSSGKRKTGKPEFHSELIKYVNTNYSRWTVGDLLSTVLQHSVGFPT